MTSERLARRPLNIVAADNRLIKNNSSNLNHLSPNDAVVSRRSMQASSASDILRRSSLTNPILHRHNSSESSRRLSLSRDPVQPTSGSLSSLKCRSLPPENEEDDVIGSLVATQMSCLSLSSYLHGQGGNRPRSFTCSDLDTKKIKNKIRNRPPTPPPRIEPNVSEETSGTQFSKSFDSSFLGAAGGSSGFYTTMLGRRSRHSSRDRLELSNLDELLPVINES